jgi:predicted helicase
MTLSEYTSSINSRYKAGNATEHTFRSDLQQLIESLVPGIRATNEPKRQSCGAPDYILTRKEIPVGFIEAKDIGDKDLDGSKKTGNKEQFDRYKASLNNIVFTDYLDFHFYRDGKSVSKISIAELTDKGIKPLSDNYTAFENLIKDFCSNPGQTIKSSKKLAEMMAAKARLLSEIIEKALTSDETNQEDSTLKDQMNAFKEVLIHDITPKGFADVYAQTIAYGMFAARLHDPTLPSFSRHEAAELIPKSNPFLRKLFGYIAGPELDDRIKWIVDSLVEIFLACNVEEILSNYGKNTKMEDPIIHFYETFLSEYDPKLRKSRGVWYTPAPVVNFIVRAVDDILKTEFGLPQGLADNSKIKLKTEQEGKKVEKEVHKVQILDPATGTGTFLAETIKLIHKKFEGQQGIWSNYVENNLIPRLNGFELLMASYAMAHLKLDLLLNETGYKPTKEQRLRVYLTNSLEEHHQDTGTLFANWLSTEANEANHIKRDTPVMCVIGNPPYSVSSSNKSEWIEKLTADYKKDLNEKNIQPLSDDYIKFIRFGQHFIDKNGSGVLAYISNNSFIDGIIHRQMRKHLHESFDTIYILDLHGNSKRKEISPDGSPDENVFDIRQGVSINLFVKTIKKSNTKKINIYNLFGSRDFKYDALEQNSISTIKWVKSQIDPNDFSFAENSNQNNIKYKNELFALNTLFNEGSNGVQTKRDSLFVDFNEKHLLKRIEYLLTDETSNDFNIEYQIKDSSSYQLLKKINSCNFNRNLLSNLLYRPLDYRKIYYDKNLLGRPFYKMLRNLLNLDNICLVLGRQGQAVGNKQWNLVSISKIILDTNLFYRGGNMAYPLYIYPEENQQQNINQEIERTPNLNPEIVDQISKKIELSFKNEKESTEDTFAPIDILDYIYAILHSPTYREKYKEFLKIDFPRVPYPKDKDTFWQLVKLGGEIRQIHLLESPVVEKFITQYPVDGNNIVTKPNYQNGKVYINSEQYFDNVPEIAWNFYIGGYQPAQKWLKDRKNRKLEFDEILHYQKMIVALTETGRIKKEIEKIDIE